MPSLPAADRDTKPRTPRLASNFAKFLRADAFVGGNVANGSPTFTVSTYVSDAYGIFATPQVSVSSNVDLSNPATTAMAGETHAAVLAAVAASLAGEGDYVRAIDVIAAAEQLVDSPQPFLADLRRNFESQLPNTGLLGTGP